MINFVSFYDNYFKSILQSVHLLLNSNVLYYMHKKKTYCKKKNFCYNIFLMKNISNSLTHVPIMVTLNVKIN